MTDKHFMTFRCEKEDGTESYQEVVAIGDLYIAIAQAKNFISVETGLTVTSSFPVILKILGDDIDVFRSGSGVCWSSNRIRDYVYGIGDGHMPVYDGITDNWFVDDKPALVVRDVTLAVFRTIADYPVKGIGVDSVRSVIKNKYEELGKAPFFLNSMIKRSVSSLSKRGFIEKVDNTNRYLAKVKT